MRGLLVFILLSCLLSCVALGSAFAAGPTGNRDNKADIWQDNGDHGTDGREGGESIPTAVNVVSLPYTDTGATCDNVNNYDEVCPYSGSTSADVVYKYTPTLNEVVYVDLCNSAYDTKVYVYAGGQGNLVACNDDAGCGYSGYQSKIDNLSLSAGTTYYFVIDGYGGACGSYMFNLIGGIDWWPCVDCPEGAIQEGEPECVDGYYDGYNGGCNSEGWTPIQAQDGDCATLCGLSCTYLYQGGSYRDTDWFTLTALGGEVTASCLAEFPLQLIFIYGPHCDNLQYDYTQAATCVTAELSRDLPANAEFWLWVGASVFSGVPESPYTLDVCGITGPPPPPNATREVTWGAVKNRFR